MFDGKCIIGGTRCGTVKRGGTPRVTLCRAMLRQVTAVDTNGAGDTFATAYMLALSRHDRQPGATANWAAARAVSQPQVRASARVTSGIHT